MIERDIIVGNNERRERSSIQKVAKYITEIEKKKTGVEVEES